MLLRVLRSRKLSSAIPISATTRQIPGLPHPYSNLLPSLPLRILHASTSRPNTHSIHRSIHPTFNSSLADSIDSRPFDAFRSRAATITSDIPITVLTSLQAQSNDRMQKRKSSLPTPFPPALNTQHRKPPYRTYITGRLGTGIEKRKSIRHRYFASTTDSNPATTTSDKSKKEPVTWREALRSPRNAITYADQLRHDFVNWLKHIWAGAKLLAADVRVSYRILKRITHGKQISRRERNFIVKTGVDLARLVPFSLFLIIPLAEFALPFALRLFPNMLPSQFQDQMKNEQDMKRKLKGRLELAKYLRDVVDEKAKQIRASDVNSELKKNAADLSEFLEAIRSGKIVDGAEVSRFAKFFNNELTIDGAVRPQLIAMCKYMGISPYGHDLFLRFKLRSRLNAIKKDDMEIMWEGGPDSLTDEEVAKACRDRGIKEGPSYSRMRKQLAEWLDLSQKKEIPSSLLILSRAFLYTKAEPSPEESEEGLVETLSSLPDDIIMDAKQAADVGESSNVDRLQEILRQAKLIEIESEQEARKEKEDEEKRKKREEEEAEKMGIEEALAGNAKGDAVPDESISDADVLRKVAAHETRVAKEAFDIADANALNNKEDPKAEDDQGQESKDEEEIAKDLDRIRNFVVSLEELSSDSAVVREREELRNLKLELAEAEQFMQETDGLQGSEIRRFKSLVSKLESEVERVDAKVGLRMKLLDLDNDGVISLDECKNVMTIVAADRDDDIVHETLKRLDADADGNISKADLARVLREMDYQVGAVEDGSQRSVDEEKSPNNFSKTNAS